MKRLMFRLESVIAKWDSNSKSYCISLLFVIVGCKYAPRCTHGAIQPLKHQEGKRYSNFG